MCYGDRWEVDTAQVTLAGTSRPVNRQAVTQSRSRPRALPTLQGAGERLCQIYGFAKLENLSRDGEDGSCSPGMAMIVEFL